MRWEKKIDSALIADLVLSSTGNRVLLAPATCVKLEGDGGDVYYTGVDPQTGALDSTQDVC